MDASQSEDARPISCPCCLFANDTFLPPSEKTGAKRENEDGRAAESNTPMSPIQCWEALKEDFDERANPNSPLLVDTHGHAHLHRESSDLYRLPSSESAVSLTCSVHPSDWNACLEYAAASSWRMAAVGVHPWYLADLPVTWLDDLETLLKTHSGCMVGEIGLCKMARFVRSYPDGKKAALELQRTVFVQQLRLAAAYHRPVSIHCVNQQGVLIEIFKQEGANLPPAMALHSFSGTAHHVKMLLQWEASLGLPKPSFTLAFLTRSTS